DLSGSRHLFRYLKLPAADRDLARGRRLCAVLDLTWHVPIIADMLARLTPVDGLGRRLPLPHPVDQFLPDVEDRDELPDEHERVLGVRFPARNASIACSIMCSNCSSNMGCATWRTSDASRPRPIRSLCCSSVGT